jgi:hypothetical protein
MHQIVVDKILYQVVGKACFFSDQNSDQKNNKKNQQIFQMEK